ncbi:MAG: hypothetical protein LQ340_002597 [Diploschistes diacapsis]|nr:MAG: hypothetical protein LQ340_002597 [Diploschistes diacapsis]
MSPIEDLRSETAKDPLKPNMRVATSESSPERLRDSVRAAPDQSLDDQSDCVDHSTAAFQGSELQISSSASLLRQPEHELQQTIEERFKPISRVDEIISGPNKLTSEMEDKPDKLRAKLDKLKQAVTKM